MPNVVSKPSLTVGSNTVAAGAAVMVVGAGTLLALYLLFKDSDGLEDREMERPMATRCMYLVVQIVFNLFLLASKRPWR